MKLQTQTRGPVTLSNINWAANMSEETNAFTASVSIVVGGKTLSAPVSNEGHGGATWIINAPVRKALDAYGATLPALPSEYGPPIAFDAELIVDDMVEDAIKAHHAVLDARAFARYCAKMAAKGHRFQTTLGTRVIFTHTEPTPALLAAKGMTGAVTAPLAAPGTKRPPSADKPAFRVGDRVRFGRAGGEQTVGVVTKVNGKSVKVTCDTGRGARGASVWNVSPGLCSHVA